jgi:hypothetical protein
MFDKKPCGSPCGLLLHGKPHGRPCGGFLVYKPNEADNADNTTTSHTVLQQDEVECCAICEAEDNDGELCTEMLATVERYIHNYNYVCMNTAWNLWRGYNTVVHGKFSTPQKDNIQRNEESQAQNSFEILSTESEVSEGSDPSDQEAFNARQHGKAKVQLIAVRRNPAALDL